MRLAIDYELCTGHGRCYALYPDLFDADDAGDAVVLVDVVPIESADRARASLACCPEGAIGLVETADLR